MTVNDNDSASPQGQDTGERGNKDTRGAILYMSDTGKWYERVNKRWVECNPDTQSQTIARAFGFTQDNEDTKP